MEHNGVRRVLASLEIMGVCDQLTDEELEALAFAAAQEAPVPSGILAQIPERAQAALMVPFESLEGREQVMAMIVLEMHERSHLSRVQRMAQKNRRGV